MRRCVVAVLLVWLPTGCVVQTDTIKGPPGDAGPSGQNGHDGENGADGGVGPQGPPGVSPFQDAINPGDVCYSVGDVGVGTCGPNLGGWDRALTISTAPAAKTRAGLELVGYSAKPGESFAGITFHNAQSPLPSGTVAEIESSVAQDGNPAEGALTFYTADANTTLKPRLAIDASGNVGIGTTNPAEKLDVVGNIKTTGDIIAGPFAVLAGSSVVQTSASVREFSGTVHGPGQPCGPAKYVTLGTLSNSIDYKTFFDVEVFGSHRGLNRTWAFSYNKFVIMAGDKVSSNRVLSKDEDPTQVDLWNPNTSIAGMYDDVDLMSGLDLTLRFNPTCGSAFDYTYVVRYYSGANFTPSAIRSW